MEVDEQMNTALYVAGRLLGKGSVWGAVGPRSHVRGLPTTVLEQRANVCAACADSICSALSARATTEELRLIGKQRDLPIYFWL